MVDALHNSTLRLTGRTFSMRLSYALFSYFGGRWHLAGLYPERIDAERALPDFKGVTTRIVHVDARVQMAELEDDEADESADERINRRGSAPDADASERAALLRLK